MNDPFSNIEKNRNTPEQFDFYKSLNQFLEDVDLSQLEKFKAFPVYTPRQEITVFLERYEIFKLISDIPGSIVECGVGGGMGIMSFLHFCSIFEPYHYTRNIFGFDTFEGFKGITSKDLSSKAEHVRDGGLNFGGFDSLSKAISIHNSNRALGHINKVELIKGDISDTLPPFLENHPELVVGLLYLDVDLYKPTLDTLRLLINRIPKGGIICFDELNHRDYPGETIALMDSVGINNLNLKKFKFSSKMSYAIIGN